MLTLSTMASPSSSSSSSFPFPPRAENQLTPPRAYPRPWCATEFRAAPSSVVCKAGTRNPAIWTCPPIQAARSAGDLAPPTWAPNCHQIRLSVVGGDVDHPDAKTWSRREDIPAAVPASSIATAVGSRWQVCGPSCPPSSVMVTNHVENVWSPGVRQGSDPRIQE